MAEVHAKFRENLWLIARGLIVRNFDQFFKNFRKNVKKMFEKKFDQNLTEFSN